MFKQPIDESIDSPDGHFHIQQQQPNPESEAQQHRQQQQQHNSTELDEDSNCSSSSSRHNNNRSDMKSSRSIDESNINDFSDIACLSKQTMQQNYQQLQKPRSNLPLNLKKQMSEQQQQFGGPYDINFDGSTKRRKLFDQETKPSAFVCHNTNSIIMNQTTSRLNSQRTGANENDDLINNNNNNNSNSNNLLSSSLGRYSKGTVLDQLTPNHIKEAFSEKVYQTISNNDMSSQRQCVVPSLFSMADGGMNFLQKESIRTDQQSDPAERSKGKVSFATVAEDEIQMCNIRLKTNNLRGAVSLLGIQSPVKRRFENTSVVQSTQRLALIQKQRWGQTSQGNFFDRALLPGEKVPGNNSPGCSYFRGNSSVGPGNGMGGTGVYQNNNEDGIQKPQNHFVILSYITKFVKALILHVAYRDFRLLEPKHFRMIGDSAYMLKSRKSLTKGKKGRNNSNEMATEFAYEEDLLKYRNNQLKKVQVKNFQVHFMECLSKVMKLVFDCKVYSFLCADRVFLPDQLAVIAWDILILLTILFHLIIFPVKLCFFLQIPDEEYQIIIYFIPFVFFTIDLLIGFNTGIFEFGVIVKERKLISKAYWKNKLPYHLALTFALFLNYRIDSLFIELLAVYIRLNQVT